MVDKNRGEMEKGVGNQELVNVSGVCVDNSKALQLASKFYGKDVSFHVGKDVLEGEKVGEARYSRSEIVFDTRQPVAIARDYIESYQNIVGEDYGLKDKIIFDMGEKDDSYKISEEMANTFGRQGKLRGPTNILHTRPRENVEDGREYSRQSMERFAQLIKMGLTKIDSSDKSGEEKEMERTVFVDKHLGRFMKIAEVSLSAFYSGFIIHEVQHLVYESEKEKVLPSKREKLNDFFNEAKSIAVMTTIFGFFSASGVGGLIEGDKLHYYIQKQLSTNNLNTAYDLALVAGALTSILIGAGLGLNKSMEVMNRYKEMKKIEESKKWKDDRSLDEKLAYEIQSKNTTFFLEAISIDPQSLWSQVFEDPRMAMEARKKS